MRFCDLAYVTDSAQSAVAFLCFLGLLAVPGVCPSCGKAVLVGNPESDFCFFQTEESPIEKLPNLLPLCFVVLGPLKGPVAPKTSVSNSVWPFVAAVSLEALLATVVVETTDAVFLVLRAPCRQEVQPQSVMDLVWQFVGEASETSA